MPRFYFHLRNDIIADDFEGMEFPDLVGACRHARACARDVAAEEVRKGRLNMSHWIEVAVESGHIVAKVTFADAIKLEGQPLSPHLVG